MNKLWKKYGKFGVIVDGFVWLFGLVGKYGGFAQVLSGFCGKFCSVFERGCSLLFGFNWGFECRTIATNINLIERN